MALVKVLQAPLFPARVNVPWFQQTQKLRIASLATDNATLVKAGPASLEGYALYNKNGSARFMKFYDEAVTPTVGTDAVDWVLTLAAQAWTQVSFTCAIPYFAGLAFGITANIGDGDDTAVAAGDIEGVLLFS